MPGFAAVSVLQRSPGELALRAGLAFGVTLWLAAWLGPVALSPLLNYYETLVEALDDRFKIDFALTHQTGHDLLGADLAILGQATVRRPADLAIGGKEAALIPGQVLKCSTAVGLLMQPLIMVVGLLGGWPIASARAALRRLSLATLIVGAWLMAGVPLTLWLFFLDIPVRVFAPDAVTFETLSNRLITNGGGLFIGVVLAAAALAGEPRFSPGRIGRDMRSE
jgi:hypothetical protein